MNSNKTQWILFATQNFNKLIESVQIKMDGVGIFTAYVYIPTKGFIL